MTEPAANSAAMTTTTTETTTDELSDRIQLRKLTTKKLLELVQGENVRASTLAVIVKFLGETDALNTLPPNAYHDLRIPTTATVDLPFPAPQHDNLPFPTPSDTGARGADWSPLNFEPVEDDE